METMMSAEATAREIATRHLTAAYPNQSPDTIEWQVEDAAVTHVTLASFMDARKLWNDRGTLEQVTERVIRIEGAQPFKGQRREDLTIVDCGDAILVISE
jgi:hypothetical protein